MCYKVEFLHFVWYTVMYVTQKDTPVSYVLCAGHFVPDISSKAASAEAGMLMFGAKAT